MIFQLKDFWMEFVYVRSILGHLTQPELSLCAFNTWIILKALHAQHKVFCDKLDLDLQWLD